MDITEQDIKLEGADEQSDITVGVLVEDRARRPRVAPERHPGSTDYARGFSRIS
ncbi:hypothetical protein UO65_1854 [Actinokineospora spheciospongiae]|uniref:Uncharacterized protein n=1 Tax=Actinokineospora spheciospongiae TaxID=909613 RepID=W7IPM1_9PSEU|nr:hypothetical protein [Actinokineospora spheciospongiae]EWC62820.1 hypothetical protein UO65_1854 [Actinokineospora spheciospongiae]